MSENVVRYWRLVDGRVLVRSEVNERIFGNAFGFRRFYVREMTTG